MSFDAIQLRHQMNQREKDGRRKERKHIIRQVKKLRNQAREICRSIIVPRKRKEQYGDGLRRGRVEAYQYILDLLEGKNDTT